MRRKQIYEAASWMIEEKVKCLITSRGLVHELRDDPSEDRVKKGGQEGL